MNNIEDLPTCVEIAANLDYLTKKTDALSSIIDSLTGMNQKLMEYGVSPAKFHAFLDQVAGELLDTETERMITENDLKKERWLEAK